MGSRIHSIEYVLPEKNISNDILARKFPEHDFNKFEDKIGIKERKVVGLDQTATDLAISAIEKLIQKHSIDRKDIDFILFCTQSPDYVLPTSACLLQNACEIPKTCGALDFNLGCSGYVYGLSLANGLIESNVAKNVLLVTSETYSKHIHHLDRSNISIFGDAATATLITWDPSVNIDNFILGTDGSGYKDLIVENGGSRNKSNISAETKSYGTGNFYSDNHLYMNGPNIFNFTISKIPEVFNNIMDKANIDIRNVDQCIFHQANKHMLNLIRKRCGVPEDKFWIDLTYTGNTVSNTIPIALKQYSEKHSVEEERKIVLLGFGVGISWGGCTLNLFNNI